MNQLSRANCTEHCVSLDVSLYCACACMCVCLGTQRTHVCVMHSLKHGYILGSWLETRCPVQNPSHNK